MASSFTCTSVNRALTEKAGLEQSDYLDQLVLLAGQLVIASKKLSVGEEHAIRLGSKDFVQSTHELRDDVAATLHGVLKFADPAGHRGTTPNDMGNYDLMIDSIDSILERVEGFMKDAANGVTGSTTDQMSAGTSSWPVHGQASSSAFAPGAGVHGDAGGKPQVRWRQLVDNHRTRFVPRLLVKHNELAPLPEDIVEAQRKAGIRHDDDGSARAAEPRASSTTVDAAVLSHLSSLGVGEGATGVGGFARQLPHPYADELKALSWPDDVFEVRQAQLFGSMEDTPLIYVSTASELQEMVNEIKATCRGGEIAIDVEHHQYRSYRGFVCLVQVSSREKDWLVDPFDIFEEMHVLNEVCSDPSILKVLHGADKDVLWLQRDFSVYLVNMFDTGQATRFLKLAGGYSLANLVSHMCGVKLDKKYQTADWRERPLSREMTLYARMDTHYLLYCYDCLRNALLTENRSCAPAVMAAGEGKATAGGLNGMREVLDRSTSLCLMQHVEGSFRDGDAAMQLHNRFGNVSRPLDSRQFGALQALVGWRDRLARQLDESWNFISPDACLWRVALAMPSSVSKLRSSCNPLPLLVQKHAQEVVDLITKPTTIADSQENIEETFAQGASAKGNGSQASAAAHTAGVGMRAPDGKLLAQSPQAPATTSALIAKPRASAQVVSFAPWPDRACSDLQPIVHICFTSAATLSNCRPGNSSISQCPTLAALFDDVSEAEGEDGEEEQGVMDARTKAESAAILKVKQLRATMLLAAAAPEPPTAEQPPPVAPDAPPAEEVVVVDDAADKDTAIPMRQAHNLRRAERRKKKRPAPAETAPVEFQADEPGDLDQESEAFRQALLGVMAAVSTAPAVVTPSSSAAPASVAAEGGPPAKKRKKKATRTA